MVANKNNKPVQNINKTYTDSLTLEKDNHGAQPAPDIQQPIMPLELVNYQPTTFKTEFTFGVTRPISPITDL
jgi:hypothetical protein